MKVKMIAGKSSRIRQYAKAVKVGGCHHSTCPIKDTPVKQIWVCIGGRTSVERKIPFWDAMA